MKYGLALTLDFRITFVFLCVLQGYALATQLGHSIVDPVPSLFTFKIHDPELAELSGVL